MLNPLAWLLEVRFSYVLLVRVLFCAPRPGGNTSTVNTRPMINLDAYFDMLKCILNGKKNERKVYA